MALLDCDNTRYLAVAWHRLQGSRIVSLTVDGTLFSMYVLTAEIALGASTETSRAMGIHLVNLPWPHLGPWMVSNVRCSSDVAFSRIWHISSTKLIAELKPLIFTLFRKPWWCWGMCLSSESVRINSGAIRTAITFNIKVCKKGDASRKETREKWSYGREMVDPDTKRTVRCLR